jgi:hypothetical protein
LQEIFDMSDTEPNTDQPAESEGLRQVREALDREKARAAELEARANEAAGAVRELAFMKAGVPTDNPVAKLYITSYDGPLEADAIKAGWEGLGYNPTPTPPPEPTGEPASEGGDANQALQDARRQLSGEGGPPGNAPEGDPIERGFKAGHDAGSRGSDRAFQAYFQEVINAAVADDPRVSHHGVIDDKTRERWANEARARQIANRDRSKSG